MKRTIRMWVSTLLMICPVAAQDLKVEPYGYFKVDLGYDSALSSHGNFAMYVQPQPGGTRTATTNLTARQTRLGLRIERETLTGRIEFDFYGGGAENKNVPVLRNAYVDVPIAGLELRAGQAPDLMSPLAPSTLNYTVMWGAGNVGYRRPLVQVSDRTDHIAWGLAIARNIGADLNGDNVLDGDASCVPVVQTRIGFPMGPDTEIGFSGHYGFLKSTGATEEEYNTWSVDFDFSVQVSSRIKLLGEGYAGANTGAYFGAVLNGDCVTDLESRGGWVNAQIEAADRVNLSIGYGIDDLANERNTSVADRPDTRSRNQVMFGNGTYEVASGVKTGIEISRWVTRYINVTEGAAVEPVDYRLQWSIQAGF
jgi:hypothetical protein